jgi:hypothetical protein
MTTTKQRSPRGSKRRAPTSTTVPKAIVEQAHLSLTELAQRPKDNASLREAVEQTLKAIAEIMAKGYSPEEVSELVRKNGFNLNLAKFGQNGASPVNKKSAKGPAAKASNQRASAQRRTPATAASAKRKK